MATIAVPRSLRARCGMLAWILSGAHNHIAPRLMELLREKGLDDVLVVIGGIIPDVDIPKLKEMGIKGIFLPGTPMQDIIDFINGNVRARV